MGFGFGIFNPASSRNRRLNQQLKEAERAVKKLNPRAKSLFDKLLVDNFTIRERNPLSVSSRRKQFASGDSVIDVGQPEFTTRILRKEKLAAFENALAKVNKAIKAQNIQFKQLQDRGPVKEAQTGVARKRKEQPTGSRQRLTVGGRFVAPRDNKLTIRGGVQ